MTTTERTRTYWLEHAWLGTHVEPGVAVDVGADGRPAPRPPPRAPPPPPPGAK
ncbi:formimidoylglutamate deiminase, partial [Streptomyces rochei]